MAPKKKRFTFFLLLLIACFLVGIVLKLEHWPYAGIVLPTSMVLIGLVYVVRFLYKTSRFLLDYVKLIFVFTWSVGGILTLYHLPFSAIFKTISSSSFAICIFILLYQFITGGKIDGQQKQDLIFPIAATTALMGVLFKIFHWPYSSFLIAIGLILAFVWFVKSYLIDQSSDKDQ